MSKRVKLYDFQVVGVDTAVHALEHAIIETADGHFKKSNCFLLHDEMGLGKTLQSFGIIEKLKLNGPILVVVPSACMNIWTENKDYDIRLFVKDGVSAKTMMNMTNRTIVVTSYDTLRNAYKYYINANIQQGSLSNDELIRFCTVNGKCISRTKGLRDNELRRELLTISRTIKYKTTNKTHLVCSPFMKQEWSLIIFDEVHKARNAESSTTKAVGFMNGHYRLCLSGTPIMNNGSELLCIWKYALGLFDLNWSTIVNHPESEYCKKIIDTISLGRKKSDLDELTLILPKRDKSLEDVILEWDDLKQKVMYINVKNQTIAELDSISNIKKGYDETGKEFNARRLQIQQGFMSKMQKLRQICIWGGGENDFDSSRSFSLWNPAIHSTFSPWNKKCVFTILLSLNRSNRQVYLTLRLVLIKYFIAYDSQMIQPSPKMVYVLNEYAKLGPTDKMIVFSTFKTFLKNTMQPWLDQIGIDSLIFSGGSRAKQQKALLQFKRNKNIRVLLIVKSAGSEGLNMQFDANVCIIMDPHFNLAVDEQAAQRIDRIGQTKEVIIRKLYMRGSIDEAMKIMQTEKQENIDVWNGAEGKGVRSIQAQGLFLSKRDTVQM